LLGGGAWVFLHESRPESVDTPKAAAALQKSAAPAASKPEAEAQALPAMPASAGQVSVPSPTAMPTQPGLSQSAVPQAPGTAAGTPRESAPQIRAAGGSVVAPEAGPEALETPKTAYSGDLPSIFSDDKPAAGTPATLTPAGSLMELFETHRAKSTSQSTEAPIEPAAEPAKSQASSQAAPPPSPATAAPKKVEKKTAGAKTKQSASRKTASAKTKQRPATSTKQPAGNASWSIRPLGAHKTD